MRQTMHLILIAIMGFFLPDLIVNKEYFLVISFVALIVANGFFFVREVGENGN